MGQTLENQELPPWSPPRQDDTSLTIMGTHTMCSESRRSLWQGQELMQIPCAKAVSLLLGEGMAMQHPAC